MAGVLATSKCAEISADDTRRQTGKIVLVPFAPDIKIVVMACPFNIGLLFYTSLLAQVFAFTILCGFICCCFVRGDYVVSVKVFRLSPI